MLGDLALHGIAREAGFDYNVRADADFDDLWSDDSATILCIRCCSARTFALLPVSALALN